MKVEVDRKSFGFLAMLIVLVFALVLLGTGIWQKSNDYQQNENIIAGLKAKQVVCLKVPLDCKYPNPQITCLAGFNDSPDFNAFNEHLVNSSSGFP